MKKTGTILPADLTNAFPKCYIDAVFRMTQDAPRSTPAFTETAATGCKRRMRRTDGHHLLTKRVARDTAL
jgi:hypothetical protein